MSFRCPYCYKLYKRPSRKRCYRTRCATVKRNMYTVEYASNIVLRMAREPGVGSAIVDVRFPMRIDVEAALARAATPTWLEQFQSVVSLSAEDEYHPKAIVVCDLYRQTYRKKVWRTWSGGYIKRVVDYWNRWHGQYVAHEAPQS